MNLHKNGTPNMVFTGVKDNPRQGPAAVQPAFGNLTTLNFIRGNWGPLDEAMMVSDNVTGERIYGSRAFDIGGPYYNYQTALSTMLMGKAVAQAMVRVADANVKKAGARLLIEYVEDDIDPKNRNADGTFALDVNGGTVDSGATVSGYRVRFLLEKSDGTLVVGDGAQAEGTLTGRDGVTSVILPICDLEATYFGTRGNQFLASLIQPKASNPIVVDTDSIEEMESMIYRLAFRELSANGGSSVPWYTVDENEFIDFSLEPNARDANDAVIDFDEMYRSKYQLTGQLTNAQNITGPVDGVYWYQDNIATVLGLLHAAEKAARPSEGDNTIWIGEDNVYSINLFGATNHQNVPYRAIVHAELTDAVVDARQVILSSGGNVIALGGGADGTLDDDAFNQSVLDFANTFGSGIPLNDIKQYPFHWVWDMGLKTETTEALYAITASRPDVIVVGATHEHGKTSTMDQTANKAASLFAAGSLIPESVIFSTSMSRGAIVPYSIRLKNHQYRQPISMGYAVAEKLADYLGSGDLVWRVARDPMHKDNKNIEHEVLDYQYKPYAFREKMWQNQCIAIESTGHNTVGLVGLQSMNPNDSSVLNSLITMAGVVQATWAMAMAYGEWSGGQMTEEQLITRCNDSITERTKGIDQTKVRITPNTQVTADDYNNGFSFTMISELTAGAMYTAATIGIESSYFEE